VPTDLADRLPLLLAIAAIVAVVALAGRVPLLRRLLSLAMLAGFVWLAAGLLGERARFDPVLGRLVALVQPDRQRVTGGEVRVPLAADGHFWVRARVNGVAVRMLVDSGATITALSTGTAEAAKLTVRDPLTPVILRTANGAVPAQTASVETLRFGSIAAHDLAAVVSPAFGDTDVLGMNFLTRLKSWRVEEGTLILVPHHPQAVAAEPKPTGGSVLDRVKAWLPASPDPAAS
jgi:aspartyl protease family protein